MKSNSVNVSGLALSIRNATDSETFDLAGQSQATISSNISSALSCPLSITHMIRLTFVVGAGKLGRQKYDENAGKALTACLRNLGYDEDRGASCVLECGGSFKMQHDTGKNLKTVVVFPKVSTSKEANVTGPSSNDKLNNLCVMLKGSPEHYCAISSMDVFEKMLASKCASWLQKKGCLSALHGITDVVKKMEVKLGKGEPLSDQDQEFYDSVVSLVEKEAHVKAAMQSQVECGRLTASEKEMLLCQVEEKITNLESSEKTQAKALEKARARKIKLESIIKPHLPHKLKHFPEILKLRTDAAVLDRLEERAKGRLLTMQETKELGRRDDILREIVLLENKSRDWFESDDAFNTRLEVNRQEMNVAISKQSSVKKKKSVVNCGSSAISKKPAATKWITPSAKPRTAKSAPVSNRTTAGGMFAAMMDSDSDSE